MQRGTAPWGMVFRRLPVATLLSTGLGAGFLPLAPGTWGSLLAIPACAYTYAKAGLAGVAVLSALFAAAGLVASGPVARCRGVADPGEIVIDEVAGQSLALAGVYAFCPFGTETWTFRGALLLAFLLFRALDIAKPGPIRRLERLGGGLGIMADDLAAGAFLGVCVAPLLLLLRVWRAG